MTANPFIYDGVDDHIKKFTRHGILRYHPCPSDPEAACKKHFLYAFFIPEKPVNPALIRLNL